MRDSKRPGRRDGRYRVLTEQEWLQARDEWEADERISASFIAEKWGVTLAAVKRRIARERWVRRLHKQLVHVPRAREPWRPTKYRPEFAEMLLEYFRRPVFVVAERDDKFGYRGIPVKMHLYPMLEEFAESIGVSRDTMHHWSVERNPGGDLKHPDFADAYARARGMQVAALARGVLHGFLSATFGGLVARNQHGWKNTVEEKDDPANMPKIPADLYANVRQAAEAESYEAGDTFE